MDYRRVLLCCLAWFASACGPRSRTSEAQESAQSRLVVVLVYDQVGSAQLDKYLPYLNDDGAIKMGIRRGAYFSDAYYAFAATYTAPGHTAIYCAGGPWRCGVSANQRFDEARKTLVPVFDDGVHAVLGHADAFASPSTIKATTVADQLKKATAGAGKVVSVSTKDRAAIPGGGKRADLTLWFDATAGGFTTSTFYRDALPAWVEVWRNEHPWKELLTRWEAKSAASLQTLLGADAQPGEGQCFGFTNSFPHDLGTSTKPSYAFKMAPQSTEYLLSLALEAVDQLQLGGDDIPDLLAISISAVDYVGHLFGPDSWEYAEALIASDKAVGEFLSELSSRTTLSVLITSDHGVGSFPERVGKGGRIFAPTLGQHLEEELVARLGPGPWIAAYDSPFFYLTETGRAKRDQVVPEALKVLNARPSVYGAYDVREVQGRTEDRDPIIAAVAKSLYPGSGGEIFLVPQEFYVLDDMRPPEHGTSHGSPWDYDRRVPVVLWGPGVKPRKDTRPIDMNHVASTLAALLGVTPPPQAPRTPLPGINAH